MYNYDNIIQRIKALAKQQGITQTFLCKEIGKRATFLNEVRLGKDRIDDSEICSIASILHTSEAYLKCETDDPSPSEQGNTWAQFGGDSQREKIAKKIMSLSTEDLLKLEKILDMILEEK